MWSPFAWKIEQIENDQRLVSSALASLDEAWAHANELADSLADLEFRISTGFQVTCSISSLAHDPWQIVEATRADLQSLSFELEDELASLRWQESNYVAEVQAARRAACDERNEWSGCGGWWG